MNIQELSAYKEGHNDALLKALELIEKHIGVHQIPSELLNDINDYNLSKTYEIDACIEGQSIIEVSHE